MKNTFFSTMKKDCMFRISILVREVTHRCALVAYVNEINKSNDPATSGYSDQPL